MATGATGQVEVVELTLGEHRVKISTYATRVRPEDPDGDGVNPIPVYVVKLEHRDSDEDDWLLLTETVATEGELTALFRGVQMTTNVFGYIGLNLPATPRIPF